MTLPATATEQGQRNSPSWIDDDEKYALIALTVKLDDPVPLQEMAPYHWAFSDARFDVPTHWREWLGTIRTKQLESSNLFLFSKMLSQAPEIDDAETAALNGRRGTFLLGFCLRARSHPHTSR